MIDKSTKQRFYIANVCQNKEGGVVSDMDKIYITKIKIKNFKLFRNVSIALNEKTVIIGNNSAGKSTLLEALALAFTGKYRGNRIERVLTEDIFNSQSVNEYFEGKRKGRNPEPPEIKISIYFSNYPDFQGNRNDESEDAAGFTFLLTYDRDNPSASENQTSFPLEGYFVKLTNFSGNKILFKDLPLTPYIIDSDNLPSNYLYSFKLLKSLTQDYNLINVSRKIRNAIEEIDFANTLTDVKSPDIPKINSKNHKATLGIISLANNAWENLLTVNLDDIPFNNLGKGEQIALKTAFSVAEKSLNDQKLILIEEPESHLSAQNLNILLSDILEQSANNQILITSHSNFVLNKMGLSNALLLPSEPKDVIEMQTEIDEEDEEFFQIRPSNLTLRYLLNRKVILVEGDSDALIVEKAYMQKYQRIPSHDGIDIISVGLAFKRYLNLAQKYQIMTAVVTDNDGDPNGLSERFKDYKKDQFIGIFFDKDNHNNRNWDEVMVPNQNTLEPNLVREIGIGTLTKILDIENPMKEDELVQYMVRNKTKCALKLYKVKENLTFPNYIVEAIDFIHG